jgi:membrane protein insertase Oxa1/YidC/SpoIIIJ
MSKDISPFFVSLYFTIVSAVTLFTLMFGLIDFLTIGLKTYVFPGADRPSWGLNDCSVSTLPDMKFQFTYGEEDVSEDQIRARCEQQNVQRMNEYKAQKAESSVRNLALIIVSLPLFITHFRVVNRSWKSKKSEKAK